MSEPAAREDAKFLSYFAARLTYNDTTAEGEAKHRLHEIAMRIETGYYAVRAFKAGEHFGAGMERASMAHPISEQGSDRVRAALAELVACKALKAEIERMGKEPAGRNLENMGPYVAADNEYQRREPLAWEEARAALATSERPSEPAPKPIAWLDPEEMDDEMAFRWDEGFTHNRPVYLHPITPSSQPSSTGSSSGSAPSGAPRGGQK